MLIRLVRFMVREMSYAWSLRNDIYFRSEWDDAGPITLSLPEAFWRYVQESWRCFVCDEYGHVWQETYADAENGCSDMTCCRCGLSETIWF